MSISYTPTTWVSGTTPLSAANMNNLESGIVAAVNALNNGFTVAGDVIFQTTLSGSAKTVAEFYATDGKHYIWRMNTDGTLELFNTTDSVSVIKFQPTSGVLSQTAVKATGTTSYAGGSYSFIASASNGAINSDGGAFATDGSGVVTLARASFPVGAINRISFFSGTGSGSFSHGLGTTPLYCDVEDTNAAAATGVANYGSTTVTVNATTAHAWKGIAIA